MSELTWDDATVERYRRVARVNLTPAQKEKRDSLRFAYGTMIGLTLVVVLWTAVAIALAVALG
ncbi:MAG: hypothetical protein MUF33_02135 [Candidatus Nanopelagicales bacterium]|jgi:hypothetical protein|nr:hypothetical protein [Candidatus Nanopelagicales bacterium]